MPSFLGDRKNLSDADVAELKQHIGDLVRDIVKDELAAVHDKIDGITKSVTKAVKAPKVAEEAANE
jgi:hypothetical protein